MQVGRLDHENGKKVIQDGYILMSSGFFQQIYMLNELD